MPCSNPAGHCTAPDVLQPPPRCQIRWPCPCPTSPETPSLLIHWPNHRRSGRELQRWAPEAGIADPLQADGLQSDRPDLQLCAKGANWDQFAANEQRFGVRTTYDEDLYTTKLDKGRAKMSAAEADRIAAEIEGLGSSASRHLMDERNAAAALDEVGSGPGWMGGWLCAGPAARVETESSSGRVAQRVFT